MPLDWRDAVARYVRCYNADRITSFGFQSNDQAQHFMRRNAYPPSLASWANSEFKPDIYPQSIPDKISPATEPPRGQTRRVSAGGARAGVRYRLDGLRRRPDVLLGSQDLQQMLVLHDHGGELQQYCCAVLQEYVPLRTWRLMLDDAHFMLFCVSKIDLSGAAVHPPGALFR